MKQENSGRDLTDNFLRVTDPIQAKLLADQNTFSYFTPFLAQERTASQAAEEVACSLNAMLYRVGTFLEAGLLKVSRLERRAGRAIKHYRSVADGFFIPFEVTPYAGLEEGLEAQIEERNQRVGKATARLLREAGIEGRRIYRSPTGEVWQEAAADLRSAVNLSGANAPAAVDFFREVKLTIEEAKVLQRELLAYRERYREEDRPGQPYLFEVLLLPTGTR